MIWVSGAGSAAWPDLPNQRLEIQADKDAYKAGDTARIFIPNPFPVNSQALVTVERGVISQSEVIDLSGSGREYSLPLTEADAPNVYVSAIVLGQGNDFRGGLVNLPVAPDDKELNVQVTASPAESEPRQDVTFDVQVTDNQGAPVEGEFSLSVVDKASLALADPNSKDILSAYYSIQPLGVETGLSVAAYTGRDASLPVGGGGGGGGDVPFLREKFPDTAYWNPSLITNSDGRGQVTMTLPDSLTTWQVDVRGLTVDTKVGETSTQVVATRPLLVRPVTPRFLVSGDHVQMAAIVNNNTSDRLTVDVQLQSEGFILDEPGKAVQQVEIPANGRVRVEWWGTAGPARGRRPGVLRRFHRDARTAGFHAPLLGTAADPALQRAAGLRHRRDPARRGLTAGGHLPAAHLHTQWRRPERGSVTLPGRQSADSVGRNGGARSIERRVPDILLPAEPGGLPVPQRRKPERPGPDGARGVDHRQQRAFRAAHAERGRRLELVGQHPGWQPDHAIRSVHFSLCDLWPDPRPPGRRQRGRDGPPARRFLSARSQPRDHQRYNRCAAGRDRLHPVCAGPGSHL